jgi:hypothetical protein
MSPSITLLSEIEIDLTQSYPHFTPFNLATLGLAPPGTFLPSPRSPVQDNSTYEGTHSPSTTSDPPYEYLWDYASPSICESSWDSSGACSCTAEATCCDDTANPTDPPHTPKRPELLSSSYGNPDVGPLVDMTNCNSDLTGDPTAKQFNPSSLSYTEISTRPLNHSTSLTAMEWTDQLPNSINPLNDPHYPLLDPSLDLKEVYPSMHWRDSPPLLDPPPDPPLDSLPLTINFSSLDLLSDPPPTSARPII